MAHQALTAPLTPALTGAVMCAVSFAASRPQKSQPLQISLPKLPNLPDFNVDLPGGFPKLPTLGGGDKPAPKVKIPPRAPPTGSIKVRASSAVEPSNPQAPSLADVKGVKGVSSIAAGDGWKRFPARRMPGANMDQWKKIAKDMSPGM